MPRLALVVPASTYRAEAFLDAVRRVGAEAVVASDHEAALPSPGHVPIDLSAPDDAADRLAAHAPLDAVLGVDDRSVEVAALAAERLGLPHDDPAAVARTRDKAAMREALAADPRVCLAGEDGVVARPEHRAVGRGDDVAALAAELGCPVVVKPVSLSASRGVIRADDPASAARAAARTRAILAEAGEDDGPLLLERYVDGAEVAVEGLLTRGSLEVLALFDKPDPLVGPYFEETLYVTPSRLPAAEQRAVADAVAAACAAIGLRHGPVHAELRLPRRGPPVLLEAAGRTIGGQCGRSLRFGLGASLEELVVRHALGMTRPPADPVATGVLMLPIPAEGLLREVGGLEEARAVPGVEDVTVAVPPDTPVRPLPEGDRYLGFAFARAAGPDEVEAALRAAHACLDVRIDPATVAGLCASC